jgi:hypothetical protein
MADPTHCHIGTTINHVYISEIYSIMLAILWVTIAPSLLSLNTLGSATEIEIRNDANCQGK